MTTVKRTSGSKIEEFGERKKSLSFFKPFIQELCTDTLMLPLAWTHYMEGNLPSKVLLRDHYGNMWPVGLEKVDNRIYFVQGWTTFVKQNYMKQGEFFFFQYDGIRIFNVKLYGTDSCAKKGVGRLVYKVKEEEGQEKNDIGIDSEEDDESHFNEEEDENESEEEYIEVSLEEETSDHIHLINSSDSKCNNGSENVTVEEGGVQERNPHKRAKSIDPHGFEIFKSGIVPRPRNPYFITKIKKNRQNELFVPVDTVKTYKLELPVETYLRDPQGVEWKTRLVVWKDGRSWFLGGWRPLCKANLIGPQDLSICEFVRCEERGLYIQVHLIPASG